MRPVVARRLARGVFGASLSLVLAGAALGIADLHGEGVIVLLLLFPVVGYGVVGMLVASRRRENPIGWLFCAVALSLAVWGFGLAYANFGNEGAEAFGVLPAAAAAGWVAILVPVAVLTFALPAFLLLFPDGRPRSARWRPAIVAAAAGATLAFVGFAATIEHWSGILPLHAPAWLTSLPAVGGYLGAGFVLVVGAGVAGLVSILVRYRSAHSEEREQLRLLVVVLGAMGVATTIALPLSWFGLVLMITVDGFGILVGIPLATAAAVLTYGLYDVGVVVKKTIVYGLLIAFFALVLGLLSLAVAPISLGARDGGAAARIVSSIVALLLVLAAAWRPTKRLARRLVYGKRATPYEAVSEFGDRLGEAYSTEDVLPRMAQILRGGTGADRVRVWLRVGGELRASASAPAEPPGSIGSIETVGDELPAFEDGERAFPVRHQGELLGAVTLRMPASEPLRGAGEKLVVGLVAQAGLVLRNVRLTEELKLTIDELRASRQRIVTAQDERARKLERDIHDGAQQQLVALSVKLRLAEQLAHSDGERAAALIGDLQRDSTEALETLRDLARGIYPPLLADKGLIDALNAQGRKSSVEVTIEPDGVGRYPAEIEAAVYFCCLEALQNVAKYSGATGATIRLADSDDRLTFVVEDDGRGFDPSASAGTGLTNMRDRLEALGGILEIRSGPGGGTTVRGTVPVRGASV